MVKEISLSDQHKAALLLHSCNARRDEQLLRWLDEIVQAKIAKIGEFKAKIEEVQAAIVNVEKEIEAVQKHKQELVTNTKTNLETILKKIVADLGIGPNSKAQLLFDGNEPKILLHE